MKIRLASIASAGLIMVGCNSTQNEQPRILSFPKPNVSLCVHNAIQACVEVPAIIPTSSSPIIASVIDDLVDKAVTIAEVGVSLDPTNPCSRSQPYKISGVFKPNPNLKTDGGIRDKKALFLLRQKLNNELNLPPGADTTMNIDFGLQVGEIAIT